MSITNSVFGNSLYTDSSLVASATGLDGFARAVISGGSAFNDRIEAIATSATTQAVVDLEDLVSGGTILADGNAQVYIDGATVSNAVFLTEGGANAAIGVYGDGSATVVGGVVSKGSVIFDDGTLTFSGGSAGANVKFLAATDAALTLSNIGLGASDAFFANGGTLTISAVAGGSTIFGAGTLVSAASDGAVFVDGGAVNSGTVDAFALGGDAVSAAVTFNGGTGNIVNAKGATMEALATSGYSDVATIGIYTISGVANSGIIEGLANGYYAGATISISGGASVANSGSLLAQAADSADAGVLLYTPGTITNSAGQTIAARANADSYASAEFIGEDDSGSLVNAKGATITVSAGEQSEDYLYIALDSAVVNSGAITLAVNGDSVGASANYVYATSSIQNAGSIVASANDNSHFDDVYVYTDAVGGSITNGGTIEAAANNDSYIDNFEIEGDQNSTTFANSGTIAAVANIGSYAEMYVDAFETGDVEINSGTLLASATAGSTAYTYIAATSANNSGGTLEAAETGGGTAVVYIYKTNISGGTLKSIGADAAIGVDEYYGSATGAKIAPGTNLLADDGDLYLTSDTFQGAVNLTAENGGSITVYGSFVNSGIVEAETTSYDDREEAGVSISAGSAGSVVNNSTMEAVATNYYSYYPYIGIYASAVTNNKLMEALGEGGYDEPYLYVSGTTSASTFTNSGTVVVSTTSASYGYLAVSAGTIGNAGTVTISADDGSIAYGGDQYGLFAGGDLGNSGTLLASATGRSQALLYISAGGTVTNTKTIAAVASDGSYGVLGYDHEGGIFASGAIANSGTILVAATLYSDSYLTMVAGGAITNAAKGVIEAVATSASIVYGYSYDSYEDGLYGSSFVNSGLVLASASGSSDSYLSISAGGTLTNAKTIEAVAAGQSEAVVDLFGSAVVNSGTVYANGSVDSFAYAWLFGNVNNSGGVLSAAGNAWVYLDGGFVSGGTLATTGPNAAIAVDASYHGEIESATIAKDSIVLAVDDGTLTLADGVKIGAGASVAATVEYATAGTIVVASAATIVNSGTLTANLGGTLVISGDVVNSGAGAVVVGQGGIVDVASGGSANITFGPDTVAGVLQIADTIGAPSAFGGIVSGFGGVGSEYPDQLIVLSGVTSGAGFTVSYTSTGIVAGVEEGTLTVTSGGSTYASITLIGDYPGGSAEFALTRYGSELAIMDPGGVSTLSVTGNGPASSPGAANVALLGSYMAALFVVPEGSVGTLTTETAQNQAVLAHPQHAT